MSVTIKIKRATAANWGTENPILSDGELGLETDTGLMKVGNGVAHWSSLPYLPVHNHEGADLTYTWDQTTPASTWTINHGLGEYLNITVATSTGVQVEGDILYQDANTIVVQFSSAFSGKAYLS